MQRKTLSPVSLPNVALVPAVGAPIIPVIGAPSSAVVRNNWPVGYEVMRVPVSNTDNVGIAGSDFAVSLISGEAVVTVNDALSIGTYTPTLTANNGAGSASESLTIDCLTGQEPPVLNTADITIYVDTAQNGDAVHEFIFQKANPDNGIMEFTQVHPAFRVEGNELVIDDVTLLPLPGENFIVSVTADNAVGYPANTTTTQFLIIPANDPANAQPPVWNNATENGVAIVNHDSLTPGTIVTASATAQQAGTITYAFKTDTYGSDHALFNIDANTGAISATATAGLDYDNPLDFTDGTAQWPRNSRYIFEVIATESGSNVSSVQRFFLIIDPVVATGSGVITTPAQTFYALSEAQQTYRTAYDAAVQASISEITADCTSQQGSRTPYTSSYHLDAAIGMILATGNLTYADQWLDWADLIIAAATFEAPGEEGVYQSWGPHSATAGNYNGTSAWLYDLQGGSALLFGAWFIQNLTEATATQTSRATTIGNWCITHIVNKWTSRGAFWSNYAVRNDIDQATMAHDCMVAAYALTSTAQYKTWADQHAALLRAQFVDSTAFGGLTPAAGSKKFRPSAWPANHSELSHHGRGPKALWRRWFIEGSATDKALLDGAAKHFNSMSWNQNTANPGFSRSPDGGSPYNDPLSIFYTGYAMSAVGDGGAQVAPLTAAANKYQSGGTVTANGSPRGPMAAYAWEMAGRAVALTS